MLIKATSTAIKEAVCTMPLLIIIPYIPTRRNRQERIRIMPSESGKIKLLFGWRKVI
jgi:hypothetical protein